MSITLIECDQNQVALVINTNKLEELQPNRSKTIRICLSDTLNDKKPIILVDVILEIAQVIPSTYTNCYWRPINKLWILTSKNKTVPFMSYLIMIWDEVNLFKVLKNGSNRSASTLRANITLQIANEIDYVVPVREIFVSSLNNNMELVPRQIMQVPEIATTNEIKSVTIDSIKTSDFVLCVHILMLAWEFLYDITIINQTIENLNSYIQGHLQLKYAQIKKMKSELHNHAGEVYLVINQIEMYFDVMLTALEQGTFVLQENITSIEANFHLIDDLIGKIVKAVRNSELSIGGSGDVYEGLVAIIISLDDIMKSIKTTAKSTEVKSYHDYVMNAFEVLDNDFKHYYGELSQDFIDFKRDLVDQINNSLAASLRDFMEQFDETLYPVMRFISENTDTTNKILDITTASQNVLQRIDVNVEKINSTIVPPITAITERPKKPILLSSPIHGIRSTMEYSDPPPYQPDGTLIFLSPSSNEVVGVLGTMPFSPATGSKISDYLSVSGVRVYMCYGPLLTYGDYLVTNASTTLTSLVPFTEVAIFEDVVVRIWYRAAIQSDFNTKAAVFYGSFSSSPLFLST